MNKILAEVVSIMKSSKKREKRLQLTAAWWYRQIFQTIHWEIN
jgi:hypothetical protein